MKRSLLIGFRALAFAVSAFILRAAVGDMRVQDSRDVFLFIIGLVIFWVVIETVFMNVKKKQAIKPPAPPKP